MPHKIEISDKTYDRLREYCTLNNLKIGQFADKLLFDGLMIELYGDVPFTNYKVKVVEPTVVEVPVVKEEKPTQKEPEPSKEDKKNEIKAIDKETKDRMIETMEKVEAEHPQTYITNQEGEKEIQKEMLKQLGVPDKVVSKITRRRLK